MFSIRTLFIIACACFCLSASAQTEREKYEAFKKQADRSYSTFRDKVNKAYADYIKHAWEEFKAGPIIPKPKEEKVEPVVMPEEERGKALENRPLPIKEVITPPTPAPQPMPLIEKKTPADKQFSFSFFGTEAKVRLDDTMHFRLYGVDEESVSQGWLTLAGNEKYGKLVLDCLNLRLDLNLSDWAYLAMLQEMADKFCGKDTNEASLLMAYVYCQSGYQMRLGESQGRLYLLYACRHNIYNHYYFEIDGTRFYPWGYNDLSMRICKAAYPKEQPLSLYVTEQHLATQLSAPRTLCSKRYADLSVEVQVNKNLLDFFSTYPCSELNDNFMTQWGMYAETPIDSHIEETLYPALKEHISGLSTREAAERLLNWVQTAFTYEYDEVVWGEDRALFAEETLYYPYCDCEDRSILLTRLYRDLLGLKCLLVYYPGHLATAVLLPGEQRGDYIDLNGSRYTIADPTYIGAEIGRTMPNMDNQEATVMCLK